jgi:hypothetical protein
MKGERQDLTSILEILSTLSTANIINICTVLATFSLAIAAFWAILDNRKQSRKSCERSQELASQDR